ncbi:hypothetical protein KAFR_0J00740 [Kazachstania africana CBS 2517]|uniref:Biogenesis of lysosome-related organelles complex 1 subunit SNN1 n=1 Tax=Kazachstania africana (strain ATCC 22294 / BCRC 22015 / CBS 2517 / CECT 1963 / NBRC 1671 / NRRL Y-8276) TaxID=1071382 RepID=H2B0J2_KAZAF|nr:hypothetical protein KAFR_0J00740 [Kazachstania africana CBS 2517]CCF60142.1 hypothetical protein KAFR_0J00740 [Kazachstania africana CBS 2517]
MSNRDEHEHTAVVHPVELSLYSLISNDLDEIFSSINKLRSVQALSILKLRSIRNSIQHENDLLSMESSERRIQRLLERLEALEDRISKRI